MLHSHSILHQLSGHRLCLLDPKQLTLAIPALVVCLLSLQDRPVCLRHCHRGFPGKTVHVHTLLCVWCLVGRCWGNRRVLVKGCGGIQDCMFWLLEVWKSLVHDTLMIFFLACFFSPPPFLPLCLSPLFLQQKTPGCSQPTYCHTSFRTFPA